MTQMANAPSQFLSRKTNKTWRDRLFRWGIIRIYARCWYCERLFRVRRQADSPMDGWYCSEHRR